MKKILAQVRKAVQDYDMISEGDRIAIGVSGGKDSMTLLENMARLMCFYPKHFEIHAVTLDMGLENMDFTPISKLCAQLDIPFTLERTNIAKIIFDIRKEPNPCSMCANLRRGALHNAAISLGCNKVALAHNMDDVIETLLLSTFYEGRLHTFSPVTYLDRKNIYLIRPLIYSTEKEIKAFVKENNIEIVHNPCKANGNTKRQVIKDLIFEMSKQNKFIKSNIFGAIKRACLDGWHE